MANGSKLRFTAAFQSGKPHIYPIVLRRGPRAGEIVYRAALYAGVSVSRHTRLPYVRRAVASGLTACDAFEHLVCSHIYARVCFRSPHMAIPGHPPKFRPDKYKPSGFPL